MCGDPNPSLSISPILLLQSLVTQFLLTVRPHRIIMSPQTSFSHCDLKCRLLFTGSWARVPWGRVAGRSPPECVEEGTRKGRRRSPWAFGKEVALDAECGAC